MKYKLSQFAVSQKKLRFLYTTIPWPQGFLYAEDKEIIKGMKSVSTLQVSWHGFLRSSSIFNQLNSVMDLASGILEEARHRSLVASKLIDFR